MRVLVACEFSGRVRDAFLAKGHDAWSCDILPTEVEGPHYLCNALEIIGDQWDLIIGHPPCTYLSDAGIAHWDKPGRKELRETAFDFFMAIYNAPSQKVCVENPKSRHIINHFRCPDQTVHPYYFGECQMKRTSLWLRGLPPLSYSMEDNLFEKATATERPQPIRVDNVAYRKKNRYATDSMKGGKDRAHNRSRTYLSIANAMAEQWGSL